MTIPQYDFPHSPILLIGFGGIFFTLVLLYFTIERFFIVHVIEIDLMVKHSTPDVVCMKTSKVSNIITQLTRAMEIQENADHTNDSHGCDSLQFAVNYTNQVLLDCIADLKRDLDMHELTFRDYQYDL